MAHLIGVTEEVKGKVFEIEDGTTVGRSAKNSIRIDAISISVHHCTFTQNGKTYSIKDEDSTNGTRINGNKINVQDIQSGDNLHIGSVEFTFKTDKKIRVKKAKKVEIKKPGPAADSTSQPVATATSPSTERKVQPQMAKPKAKGFIISAALSLIILFALAGYFFYLLSNS